MITKEHLFSQWVDKVLTAELLGPDRSFERTVSGPDGAVGASHVLTALGLDTDAAQRSLRIGLGRFTSGSDIEAAAALLSTAVRRAASARAVAA